MDELIGYSHHTNNYSQNVFLLRTPRSASQEVPIVGPILAVICYNTLAFIGNILILKIVPKISSNAMADSSKVCLMGQAVTDLVFSFVVIIGPLAEIVGDSTGWMYGRMPFCRVVGFLATSLLGVSIWHIALLNTDRYLFIARPMLYHRLATRNRIIFASIILFTFHTSALITFVFVNDDSVGIIRKLPGLMCVIDFKEPAFLPYTFCIVGMAWLVLVFLVIQYVHIIKISTKHLKRIKPLVNNVENVNVSRTPRISVIAFPDANATLEHREVRSDVGNTGSESNVDYTTSDSLETSVTTNRLRKRSHIPSKPVKISTLRKNLKILRTPLIIICCFFFTYLPITFINIHLAVTGQSLNNSVDFFFTCLVTVNGGINTIVYYFTIKPFKEILKNMLRRS